MKRLTYFYILCLLATVACSPSPLDITLDNPPPKLVIASQIVPEQIMIVSVSRSFGALEYNDSEEEGDSVSQDLLNQVLVTNAEVSVTYNGITEVLQPIEDGVYGSANVPQFLNTDYELRVTEPGTGQTVSSTARMLELVQFQSVSAVRSERNDLDVIDVEYSIDDPTGDHWYMVNFYAPNSDNESINPYRVEAARSETQLLTDKEFSANMISTETQLYDWPSDTLYVAVSNISQGYYDYLSLRLKSQNSSGDFLSEPVSYPTNIEGGYGYFTTHYPDVRVFEVQK